MLVFIDESWQTNIAGNRVASLAAVAVPAEKHNELARRVFNMKKKHFGVAEMTEAELKGDKLFKKYAFRCRERFGYSRNLSCVEDMFSLCRELGLLSFATITSNPKHMSLTTGTKRLLTTPYSYLMERIDRCMAERLPGRMANVLFDSRGLGTDEPLAVAFSNFLFRSPVGQQHTRILATPFFVVSRLTPGIQIADVFAYVAAQVLDGRPECQPYYQRLQDLQWVSNDRTMWGIRHVK
jgi:hypothetical protein